MSDVKTEAKPQRMTRYAERQAALAGGTAALERQRMAEAAKTARLRTLRLAKEEADRTGADVPKVRGNCGGAGMRPRKAQ